MEVFKWMLSDMNWMRQRPMASYSEHCSGPSDPTKVGLNTYQLFKEDPMPLG